MKTKFNKDIHQFNFSGKAVILNTSYNLIGYFLPVLFAIVIIPKLINYLGVERFGILSIAWMIIGYFSFFDFGIGKSLTKLISEKISKNEYEAIPKLFWNSIVLIFMASLFFMVFFYLGYPFLFEAVFNLSDNSKLEAYHTFQLLIISIPIVTTTATIRGFLEAYQKFRTINILRAIMGIFTFLLPIIVVTIINSLFWIIFSLLILRILIWFLYFIWCVKTNVDLLKDFSLKISYKTLKPILKFSIWITIANIVGPLILYSDRFLISSILSATAITYYSTPYEIITKLLMLSSALVVVLFPNFSASIITSPVLAKKIFKSGVKFIFIIVFPFIFIFTTYSHEFLTIWISKEFADNSFLVLKLLGFGILFSSISSIPNNFFQGVGKPNIPAILNLIELPLYLIGMWFFISKYGINGAAFFWSLAAILDTIANFYLINRFYQISFNRINSYKLIFLIGLSILVCFLISQIILKVFISVIFILLFFLFSWKVILATEEKIFIKSFLKKFI